MDLTAGSELYATFALVAAIWLAALVTPGPDFLATVHTALSGSRRAGALVGVGVGVGIGIWATASLLGLGLLFRTAEWLYVGVKLAGAAFLVYLGVRLLWSARRPGTAAHAPLPRVSNAGALRRGLLTNLSNPKAAAIFGSLFAALVPPDAPLWFDATLVATMAGSAAGWYVAVAWVMASGPVAALYRRLERLIAVVTGALFIGLGARLATDP